MSVDAGLLARVRVRLAGDGGVPTPGRVAAALREEGGALRGDAELLGVLRTLQSEIAGAGVLEPLLAGTLHRRAQRSHALQVRRPLGA